MIVSSYISCIDGRGFEYQRWGLTLKHRSEKNLCPLAEVFRVRKKKVIPILRNLGGSTEFQLTTNNAAVQIDVVKGKEANRHSEINNFNMDWER